MALDMVSQGGNFSVVENFNEKNGSRCGYCKSKTSNYSHGMWAHQMTVQDYQDLIDRGWRRSGNYCYKPTMRKICCPMYTIKCSAINFKLSKSQKKVVKRMNKFLAHGERGKRGASDDDPNSSCRQGDIEGNLDWTEPQQSQFASEDRERFDKVKSFLQELHASNDLPKEKDYEGSSQTEECSQRKEETTSGTSTTSMDSVQCPKPGQGVDEGKPPCKKAKLMRLERRQQKLAIKQTLEGMSARKDENEPKKLEDLLHPEMPQNPAHRLQVRLVRSQPSSAEFKNSFAESLNVYRRYQMTIHGDSESECTESQYKRFLVRSPLELKLVRGDSMASLDQMWLLFVKYQKKIHNEQDEECDREAFREFLLESPLKPWRPTDGSGPPQGYGSFHQQYWLDDKLIAVGVVDILPRCVSSVYFYYDPDYSDLSLGTYGSLREVAFVRTLNVNAPELKWYYMGFYIHSCQKMRYKAGLSPSMLLCPETYTWHPVEHCFPLLDKEKYCRLEPDVGAVDANLLDNIREVLVFCDGRPMYYGQYRELKGSGGNESEDEEVTHYAELVGRVCAKRMFLLR